MQLLNDMALFVEVVKAKGFRRAAEKIGMPNSTLSRRINGLEKTIGLRLLHRTTRKIELTEAGQLYFDRCKRIVDETRWAHEQLSDMLAQPTGVLRASLPVDFGLTYLTPLIAEFAQRYPGISYDFDLTPRRVDLVSDPFDVAIRIGELEDSQLIARPLATLKTCLYASPGYLQRAGEPMQPSDLARHACLSIVKDGLWTLHDGVRTVMVPCDNRFVFNSVGMLKQLALLDLGIVLMPEEVVADEWLDGRLRRLMHEWQGAPTTVYAMTETRLLPAKTQRFIEFLQMRLSERE